MNIKTINLDINKKIYDKLIAKQGDVKSRYLLFNLNINGAAIDLTNKDVRVYAIKPDGYEVFNDLTISDAKRGTCILELTTQILAICGIVKMELVITEGQKKLSSFEFELEVIKSLNNETAIVSTNEFTALIKALASLNEYDNYKNEINAARGTEASIKARLDKSDINKVDKIAGKGLSTNDYTTDEKAEVGKVKDKANNIDNSRTTTAKDVTGAINELNNNKVNTNKTTFNATLLNGWKTVEYYRTPCYGKIDELDIVFITGTASSGTDGHMFTLPEGYRPLAHIVVPSVCQYGADYITLQILINIDGKVSILNHKANLGKVSLNIFFRK